MKNLNNQPVRITSNYNISKFLIILLIVLNINVLFSQETYSDTYTPSGNGYIMTVPFEFKFLNCTGSEGIPHLSVSKKTKNTTSNKYKYNGEIYTERQLGSGSFSNMRKYIGNTDIEVGIYDGDGRLGTVTLTNVTGYGIGCQGQLYDVFKKLGINGKQYKDRINKLSIYNLRIIRISNSDVGLEMKIEDYNKNKQLESLLRDANYSFSALRYEEAEEICNEIKKIEYLNARANEILEKIKKIRKNENKEKEYKQFISNGDEYFSNKDFIKAKKEYKKALSTGVDNEKAEDRIWDAENAINKENSKELVDAKENKPKESSKPKETKKTHNVSGNSGGNSNSNESENEKSKNEDEADKTKANGDDGQAYRNRRKRWKEEEEKRKKKQAAEIKKASEMGAKAITGTISALSDWDDSFIGIRMSTRTLFSGETEYSFSPTTYEFTMGSGGGGFFIGYGSQEKGEDSFGTMIGGFEKQLFNVKNIFKVGLIVEGGKGNLNDDTIDSSNLREAQKDEVWFYGGGIYIKLLKYAYFSYTIGNSHFNKTTSTSILEQQPWGWVITSETLKRTELYSGLRFGINIPL